MRELDREKDEMGKIKIYTKKEKKIKEIEKKKNMNKRNVL